MIDIYKKIDEYTELEIEDYRLEKTGMVFKKIDQKDIFLNQSNLVVFYMWQNTGSLTSSVDIKSYDQFKYTISSSVNFIDLGYENINKSNQKLYFLSASIGYVLNYDTLMYDQKHERVAYYYGYANKFGDGTPFNKTSSNATDNIPSESISISPSMLAYYSIKNTLADEAYVKNNSIQVNDSFIIDEFVYIKIPRYQYHEELLKSSFSLTLASGSTSIEIIDSSNVNVYPNERPVVTLLSSSLDDVYGILDTKNALAIVDANKIRNIFGDNILTTQPFALISSSAIVATYDQIATLGFSVPVPTSYDITPYTSSCYPNLDSISKLLYSGSQVQEFKAYGLETEITDEYYIRIGAGEFNISSNPTYLTGWTIKKEFLQNPLVYITTIGLYNDNNDCLAIAKLSKPLKKKYEDSYMIKIRFKQ